MAPSIEEQIERLNRRIEVRNAWLNRTIKIVWRLVVVLIACLVIANILTFI